MIKKKKKEKRKKKKEEKKVYVFNLTVRLFTICSAIYTRKIQRYIQMYNHIRRISGAVRTVKNRGQGQIHGSRYDPFPNSVTPTVQHSIPTTICKPGGQSRV